MNCLRTLWPSVLIFHKQVWVVLMKASQNSLPFRITNWNSLTIKSKKRVTWKWIHLISWIPQQWLSIWAVHLPFKQCHRLIDYENAPICINGAKMKTLSCEVLPILKFKVINTEFCLLICKVTINYWGQWLLAGIRHYMAWYSFWGMMCLSAKLSIAPTMQISQLGVSCWYQPIASHGHLGFIIEFLLQSC